MPPQIGFPVAVEVADAGKQRSLAAWIAHRTGTEEIERNTVHLPHIDLAGTVLPEDVRLSVPIGVVEPSGAAEAFAHAAKTIVCRR